MEKEEKTCGKCKHFRRHYVRRESDWYMPLRGALRYALLPG